MLYLSCICNSQAVQRSHSHVNDLLPPQPLHHLRLPHVNVCPVTQTEVIALPPAHVSNERTTLMPAVCVCVLNEYTVVNKQECTRSTPLQIW